MNERTIMVKYICKICGKMTIAEITLNADICPRIHEKICCKCCIIKGMKYGACLKDPFKNVNPKC